MGSRIILPLVVASTVGLVPCDAQAGLGRKLKEMSRKVLASFGKTAGAPAGGFLDSALAPTMARFENTTQNLITNLDSVLEKRIAQIGDVLQNAISKADNALGKNIEKLDQLLGSKLDRADFMVDDALAQLDSTIRESLDRVDEILEKSIGNLDLTLAKTVCRIEDKAASFENTTDDALRHAFILILILISLTVVLSLTIRPLPSDVGIQRSLGRRAAEVAGLLACLVAVVFAANAIAKGLLESPPPAENACTKIESAHLDAYNASYTALDLNRARLEAYLLAIINPLKHQAKLAKVELIRNTLARPTATSSSARVSDLISSLERYEATSPDSSTDPDIMAIKALLLWRLADSRREEFIAAQYSAAAIPVDASTPLSAAESGVVGGEKPVEQPTVENSIGPRRALEELALSYLERYLKRPIPKSEEEKIEDEVNAKCEKDANDCEFSEIAKKFLSREELEKRRTTALARLNSKGVFSTFAEIREVTSKLVALQRDFEKNYAGMLIAATAWSISPDDDSSAYACGYYAYSIISSWEEFGKSMQNGSMPRELSLALGDVNFSFLAHARKFSIPCSYDDQRPECKLIPEVVSVVNEFDEDCPTPGLSRDASGRCVSKVAARKCNQAVVQRLGSIGEATAIPTTGMFTDDAEVRSLLGEVRKSYSDFVPLNVSVLIDQRLRTRFEVHDKELTVFEVNFIKSKRKGRVPSQANDAAMGTIMSLGLFDLVGEIVPQTTSVKDALSAGVLTRTLRTY